MSNHTPEQLNTDTQAAVHETGAQARIEEMARQAAEMPHDELAQAYAEVKINHEDRIAAMEARLNSQGDPGFIARTRERLSGLRYRTAVAVGAVAAAAVFAASLGGNGNTAPDTARAQSPAPAAGAASPAGKEKTFGSAGTIAGAVENLDIDNSAKKRESALKERMGTSFKKQLNNTNHKMNAMPADSTKAEMETAIGLAQSSDTDEGNAYSKGSVNFNSKHNRAIDADTGMTQAEEEAFNKEFMTNADCKIDNDFSGTVENGYMLDGGEIKAQREYFSHERVLICESKDNGTLMFKISKDKDGKVCLNLIRKVEGSAPKSTTKTPFSKNSTSTVPGMKTTQTRETEDRLIPGGGEGGPVMVEDKPETKKPETKQPETKKPETKKPETKQPEDKPPVVTPPEDKPPVVTPPEDKPPVEDKDDKNTVPAGVAGQNGGTEDKEGKGPAGQTPDTTGHIPTETPAPAPAPEPTPPPIVVSGPEPTASAETGNTTPPATPPVVGGGATAPTPTQDVVIND